MDRRSRPGFSQLLRLQQPREKKKKLRTEGENGPELRIV
jgi:hypothetical protein